MLTRILPIAICCINNLLSTSRRPLTISRSLELLEYGFVGLYSDLVKLHVSIRGTMPLNGIVRAHYPRVLYARDDAET